MFDQLKDLYNLRKQAQEMEKQLNAVRVEGTSSDQLVKIAINGKHDILDVVVAQAESYDAQTLAKSFKEAYGQAQGQLQKILMEKFRGMM